MAERHQPKEMYYRLDLVVPLFLHYEWNDIGQCHPYVKGPEGTNDGDIARSKSFDDAHIWDFLPVGDVTVWDDELHPETGERCYGFADKPGTGKNGYCWHVFNASISLQGTEPTKQKAKERVIQEIAKIVNRQTFRLSFPWFFEALSDL